MTQVRIKTLHGPSSKSCRGYRRGYRAAPWMSNAAKHACRLSYTGFVWVGSPACKAEPCAFLSIRFQSSALKVPSVRVAEDHAGTADGFRGTSDGILQTNRGSAAAS